MCINRILNIKEARKFFIALGCSHFHMAREYTDRYFEYKKLEITEVQEEEWRKDALKSLLVKIQGQHEDRDVFESISMMETIISNSKDMNNAELIRAAIALKRACVDSFTKLLLAESTVRVMGVLKDKDLMLYKELESLSSELAAEVIDGPLKLSVSTNSEKHLVLRGILDKGNIISRAKEVLQKNNK